MDYKYIHIGGGTLATQGWSIYTTETLKWHLKKHEGWEGDVSFQKGDGSGFPCQLFMGCMVHV